MKYFIAILCCLSLFISWVQAEIVPSTSGFQGLLTDTDGTPLDGTFDLTFRYFDSPAGGTLLGEEMFPATDISNGRVAEEVGYPTSLAGVDGESMNRDPDSVRSNFEVFLEILVDGDVLAPRIPIVSAPYAVGARRISGDVFTWPGHLGLYPYDTHPVSDCTYVPLELAVDTRITRIRLKTFDPAIDCTYVPLELACDPNATQIGLRPPTPVSDCTYVPLELVSDPNRSEIFIGPPVPGAGKMLGEGIVLRSDSIEHKVDFYGNPPDPVMTMNAMPSSGGSLVMFNPQPEPPGFPDPWMELHAAASDGSMLSLYNTEFDPGPATVQLSGGNSSSVPTLVMQDTRPGGAGAPVTAMASMTSNPTLGSSMILDVDVSSGINPCTKVLVDPVNGGLFQMEGDAAGGINPCAKVAADAATGALLNLDVHATSGINPCSKILVDPINGGLFQMEGDVAGGINPCVKVLTAPATGSELTVDIQSAAGIAPCVRVAADPTSGGLLQVDGDVAGGIVPCVRVAANPATGTTLEVEYEQQFGINPCCIIATDASGVALNLSRTMVAGPLPVSAFPGRTARGIAADSVSIAMNVDSNVASMELFAGAGGTETPISLKADGAEARIGINTGTPQAALDVVGDICVTGSVGACSDVRYKRDIHTIGQALDKVSRLRGVDYEWRQEEFSDLHFPEGRQIGVIAQDVEAVLPELVSTRSDDMKSVDYTKLTAVLIEAVKELKADNDRLRARLDRLESTGSTAVTR